MDRVKHLIWFAVAALMLIDALAYTFGALGPIRRAVDPADRYWQKRLLLNLMLANEGMYMAVIVACIGSVMKLNQQRGGNALLVLTLLTCVYTLVTVPLLTPSDSAHTIPRALAAVLIVIGFLVT